MTTPFSSLLVFCNSNAFTEFVECKETSYMFEVLFFHYQQTLPNHAIARNVYESFIVTGNNYCNRVMIFTNAHICYYYSNEVSLYNK